MMNNCRADAVAELLYWSILISSYTIQDAEEVAKEIVGAICTEVANLLEPLASYDCKALYNDLAKFLHEASNV
jgi:hypothetical protein